MVPQIEKTPLKKIKTTFPDGIGIIYINTNFNNTIVTVTDLKGAVIYWSSAGKCGWKGTRKRTPFAAETVAKTAIKDCMDKHKLKQGVIIVKGVGRGRESAVKAVLKSGLKITLIRDVSNYPHNGCRPPNKRRT